MHYRASDLKGLQQQRLGSYFRAKSDSLDRGAADAQLGKQAEQAADHETRRIRFFRRWRTARA